MRLDISHLTFVEHGIAPPMREAITLPVLDDTGRDTGVAIYIATSPFNTKPNDETVHTVARTIVERLGKLREG